MADVIADDNPGPDAGCDPWRGLRRFTTARIALGHTGVSQLTAAQLEFQLAHARARDAVYRALDTDALARSLAATWPDLPPALVLHSAAENRNVYLQRPDLGRRLDARSRALLSARHGEDSGTRPYDMAIVIADGLSALAVEQHAGPLLQALRARLAVETWTLAPIAIAEQGRVAVGDEIGELLGAKMVLVLIGERPGLSSPDSMGMYMTWMPQAGLTDERRNCISNVRPAGLGFDEAAARLHHLLREGRRLELTGVGLKDETCVADAFAHGGAPSFLL